MDITGTIKKIGNIEQIKDTFKKREFVVTDNSSQYPQHLALELTQDKCGLVDTMKIGDVVKCYINLRGREWTDKEGKVRYFNTIQVWKIEVLQADNNGSTASSSSKSENDDLPF